MTNSECLEPPVYPLHDGCGVFNDAAARLLDYLDRMSGSNPDQGGTNGHTSGANANNRARDDNRGGIAGGLYACTRLD